VHVDRALRAAPPRDALLAGVTGAERRATEPLRLRGDSPASSASSCRRRRTASAPYTPRPCSGRSAAPVWKSTRGERQALAPGAMHVVHLPIRPTEAMTASAPTWRGRDADGNRLPALLHRARPPHGDEDARAPLRGGHAPPLHDVLPVRGDSATGAFASVTARRPAGGRFVAVTITALAGIGPAPRPTCTRKKQDPFVAYRRPHRDVDRSSGRAALTPADGAEEEEELPMQVGKRRRGAL